MIRHKLSYLVLISKYWCELSTRLSLKLCEGQNEWKRNRTSWKYTPFLSTINEKKQRFSRDYYIFLSPLNSLKLPLERLCEVHKATSWTVTTISLSYGQHANFISNSPISAHQHSSLLSISCSIVTTHFWTQNRKN